MDFGVIFLRLITGIGIFSFIKNAIVKYIDMCYNVLVYRYHMLLLSRRRVCTG